MKQTGEISDEMMDDAAKKGGDDLPQLLRETMEGSTFITIRGTNLEWCGMALSIDVKWDESSKWSSLCGTQTGTELTRVPISIS